ncbi:2-polyprenyl-6-methoxyphenol hydroxylase-like FAD-dependent oxidoreductase [Silvibacterium bohemicum]|uniref:2-polyprenyl-6-methoxyphenol hydroxylase-like FAD-dependent oxidoreductase n=1 Tax=Silvibacterium bohemicum TaxID=1577686 RepID=A0A841JSI0_9BACT|nr:FAD-dependent monooxygenase [Silvibacterium bohemicum]MBB6144362.1 2-polyprenyl-6-methoxyphenol hydroxylase-like FAD-dependent oxidoreductase [Silvibacterium bohemicum]
MDKPIQRNRTVSTNSTPSVLISGASFAGLAAAWWMNKLGYSVTVVEIAKGLRKGGTPVNIRDGVIDVVRSMNLLERIKSESLPLRPMTFLDVHGSPLPLALSQAEEAPEEEYEIERDVLLDMLFGEVSDHVEFVFADSISGLEETTDEVAVTFASGRQRSFSLVLGCDGTHSAVRRLCFGEESSFLIFLQCYFSLTIVHKLLIEEDTSQMLNVAGKAIMLNAYNGKTDIAFCFSSDKEIDYDRRNTDGQKRMIRENFEDGAFGAGSWRTRELLDEMSRCEDFYFDKLSQVRMSSWSKGRIALVGDAGYCPSPAAGMGGSVAILGAAALADALGKHQGDFNAAFQAYDKSFRPIVEAIQTQAVEFGLEMFLPRTEEAIQKRNERLSIG